MTAFLAWLAGIFSKELIVYISDFLSKAYAQWQAKREADKKENDQAASDMQKAKDLTPDATAKDVSSAIDDASSHF